MKLKLTLMCVSLLFAGIVQQAIGQNLTITGKVKNSTNGDPLIGATILVQGTTNKTVADADGNFSINADKGATLVVSYAGMLTEKIKVSNASAIEVQLAESSKNLSEVVVIGYGTQKITKISGAISSIKSADIVKLKPTRIEEALQGQASGVSVVQNGSPGSKPYITIRGIPSFTGNGPLVVIDGVPQTQDDLNSLNPADVESITVLKDAATTAIYGVSGGNGVIIVTTKAGRKNQKTEFNINTNYGVQEVTNTLPVLNATEYGAIINEGSTAAGGNIIFPDLSKLGVGTDWQNQIFKKAPLQNYSISARGGSNSVAYFLSGGYLSQGGIIGGYDKSKFNRLNFTSNFTFDLTPKLKFLLYNTYSNLSSKGIQENSFNSILGSAINYDPTVPLVNTIPNTVGANGFSNRIFSEIFNPVTKLENTYNQNIGNKFNGKLELQFQVLKNLKLTTRYGYTKYDGNAKTFNPLVFYGLNNVDNSIEPNGSPVAGRHNSVAHDKANFNSFTYELYGNYDFKIRSHNFETVLGMSLGKEFGNTAGSSRQDVPFNSWDFADYTAATGNNSASNPDAVKGYYYQYAQRSISYFARINYDYKEKYLASLQTRRDGSTVFGKDHKFGIFPTVSLGWVVSKENFFASKFIDFLKIRGSYGAVGNRGETKPQFAKIQTDYLASLYGTGSPIGYTFGPNFVSGSSLGALGNDELGWESQLQGNIGFDMNFYKSKFNITADYYEKRTRGLLYTASISPYLGIIPPPTENIGSTKVSGIDLSVGYNSKIANDFTLNTSVNFTTTKSLVTGTNAEGTEKKFGGGYFNGQSQTVTVFEKDKAPAYYFGYKTDGLFQDAKQIAASAKQPGAVPGDIKFVDVNGDGVIDANDKTEIGNPTPDFTMGWNLSLNYKNVDFNVYSYASVGNSIYRAFERNGNYTNKFQNVLDRWTGPGSTNDAKNPRYSFDDPNNNSRVSDRYVEDGSFIKIKNIMLGYTLQIPAVKKVFKGVRIYGQVKNAFTFTKYTGFDPELSSGGLFDLGIDRGNYPQARTYAVGLDIKF